MHICSNINKTKIHLVRTYAINSQKIEKIINKEKNQLGIPTFFAEFFSSDGVQNFCGMRHQFKNLTEGVTKFQQGDRDLFWKKKNS